MNNGSAYQRSPNKPKRPVNPSRTPVKSKKEKHHPIISIKYGRMIITLNIPPTVPKRESSASWRAAGELEAREGFLANMPKRPVNPSRIPARPTQSAYNHIISKK